MHCLFLKMNRECLLQLSYAVLSLEKRTLTYANAGHNPPFLIIPKDGNIKKLTRTGMALGIEENTEIDECEIHFDKDDCLLMYTDGLTEAISLEDDLFGDERLEAILIMKKVFSPARNHCSIEKVSVRFYGDRILSDDLTMMIIKTA